MTEDAPSTGGTDNSGSTGGTDSAGAPGSASSTGVDSAAGSTGGPHGAGIPETAGNTEGKGSTDRTGGSFAPPDSSTPPPPPSLTPADTTGGRPLTEGPAPVPPAPVSDTAVAGGPPPSGTSTAVLDPPPPTPPSAPASDAPRRPGMGMLPIAVGVGLLAATVVLETSRSRSDGDLDWSNYSVGLTATAGLLLISVLALALGGGRGREDLVTWPGVVGILGAGAMTGIGLEEVDGSQDWLAYLVGGLVAVLSLAGYAAVRRGAFTVTAIVGLGIAYLQLADDVIVDIGDDDDQAIVVAAAVTAFVLVVTALGWLLRSRALTGIVAGVIGVVGLNTVLLVIVVATLVDQFFGGFEASYAEGSSGGPSMAAPPDYDNDVYVILGMAAVLTLLWALAAGLNGNPGFTVLAILMPATVVPLATYLLAVEHPTYWGAGLGAAGGLLLAAVGLRQMRVREKH